MPLRLLSRPFWDRSRVIIATWLAGYCFQFLAVHIAFAKPADIKFMLRVWPHEIMREGIMVGRTAAAGGGEIVCREY